MQSQDKAIKLSPDSDNIVQILDVKSDRGRDGRMWYLYTVKKDGQIVKFFAPTEKVHQKLSAFKVNDIVNIHKEEWGAGKTVWKVEYQGEGKGSTNVSIDDRTHDIHKQVCLKLAMDMMDKKNEVLTTGDLVTIEANMMQLLTVLESGAKTETETEEKDEFDF